MHTMELKMPYKPFWPRLRTSIPRRLNGRDPWCGNGMESLYCRWHARIMAKRSSTSPTPTNSLATFIVQPIIVERVFNPALTVPTGTTDVHGKTSLLARHQAEE